MDTETLPIAAHIDGRRASRADVLGWEARRAAKVLKKLGVNAPSSDVMRRREALVVAKLELGHDGIQHLLARELRWAAWAGRVAAIMSRVPRRLCTVELACDKGSGEVLPSWYDEAMASGDEAQLLAGSPDHYIMRRGADGGQEIVETTGGSPLAMRIFLDESDTHTLRTPADSAFPVQWAAMGRTRGGVPIGGIRHQFRDELGGGFRARLTVEFPRATPTRMLRAHGWHLACEFSNWIEAANGRFA